MGRKSKLLKEKLSILHEGEYTKNLNETFNDISDVSDIMDIDLSNNSNDDIYNYLQLEKISEGKDSIIKCDKKVGGVVTIPDNVFAISDHAFEDCDKITAIILPRDIGYIGFAAFNNCSSLQTIVIPNVYFEIRRYAFRKTRIAGLDDIYYLGDRESYRKYPISEALRNYGISESQVWFTEGRTKFDDYKKALDWFFAQPDEVQDNPDVMDTLISKFDITWDEADAIYDLVNDSLYSYDDMLSIWYDWERRYNEAMKNLHELKKQSFTINESLQKRKSKVIEAFIDDVSDISDLSNLDVSKDDYYAGFLDIQDGVLIECLDHNITEIKIPSSVTSIGDRAFLSCDRLTSITIPDSVTRVGEGAFYFCRSLKDVYYQGTEKQWNNIEIGDSNYHLLHATIHYNSKNKDLTEAAQDQQLVSNGIYSVLNDKWIKEPVQGDIPDIDMDAFKKEFDVWEERYQELLNSIKEVDIGEEEKK